MGSRIALFGGSFDPIHVGHLICARSIAERLDIERVVLIPSPRPPHKQAGALADPRHRLVMARLATQGEALFEVSDAELRRGGPSYTFDTVTAFRNERGPATQLYWIIGADSLPELPTWYRIAELVQILQIVTAARPGWSPPGLDLLAPSVGPEAARELLAHCLPTPGIDVSATEIRARVRAGKSIRYLVPDAVASYITASGVYA